MRVGRGGEQYLAGPTAATKPALTPSRISPANTRYGASFFGFSVIADVCASECASVKCLLSLLAQAGEYSNALGFWLTTGTEVAGLCYVWHTRIK